MKPEATSVTVNLAGGKQISFETGKLAKQAHGAAVVRLGENVVLATAVANPEPREGIDFFPLTVDYREYTYAGGRFPGGFIKREGRMSEREVLTSRQIDRPVRPMFAEGFKCETQVIAFVLSADTNNDPDVLGINAASCALTLSDIPFLGPIGAVRVGLVNGQFTVNPTYDEMRESLVNIMVVGTADGIVMIESGAKEVKEDTVLDAIEFERPVVLGDGGAAAAFRVALPDARVFARKGEWPPDVRDADLVINATAARDEVLVDLGPGQTLVDLPYPRTATADAAAASGARVLGGLEVLVAQGAKSFELWTGVAAPLTVMRRALGLPT